MKLKNIFATDFSIQLAQSMAERQRTLNPQDTFRRLFIFGAIGFASFATFVAMTLLIRSSFGDDPNTRTFFLFTSFVGVLVFVASIFASLIFLWDGFIGQYIQRLALEDIQADGEFNEALVVEIPVSSTVSNLPLVHGDLGGLVMNLSLKFSDGAFVRDDDVSTHLVDRQLNSLKQVLSHEDWNRYHFESYLAFFSNLPETATFRTTFSQRGRTILSSVFPVLADPSTVEAFGLVAPLSKLLAILPNTLAAEEADEVSHEETRPTF
jgi:hypothetical protein